MYGPACSTGATDPCKIGAMGSIPIRSTELLMLGGEHCEQLLPETGRNVRAHAFSDAHKALRWRPTFDFGQRTRNDRR